MLTDCASAAAAAVSRTARDRRTRVPARLRPIVLLPTPSHHTFRVPYFMAGPRLSRRSDSRPLPGDGRPPQEDVRGAVGVVINDVGRLGPENDVPAVRGVARNRRLAVQLAAEGLDGLTAGLEADAVPQEDVLDAVGISVDQGGRGGLPRDPRAVSRNRGLVAAGSARGPGGVHGEDIRERSKPVPGPDINVRGLLLRSEE